ncbi:MAG: response regulator [Deltaproteobacteria bacterium]|nr:response regulator [Deltaproteobacteria bacterium]
MTQHHILIVEDEQKIALLIQDYLQQEKFRTTIISHGDQVLPAVRKSPPDLVLLDIMLPGLDGLAVCREIRKFSFLPIIMLTAKVEEIDRLLGLEMGADDYICKPFSPREVVARVKAVLRRTRPEPAEQKLVRGPLTLDADSRQATVNGTLLMLTPSEFKLLQVFMSTPNKVFSRDELVQRIQGYDYEGYERTVDSHIKNLRKKTAALLPGQEVIMTVYGVGYKLSLSSA